MKAGVSKEVVLNYTDYQSGKKQGKIHINDKYLDFDDDYFFTYEVLPYSSILLINGEDANSAVNQVYSLDKYYRLHEVKFGSFLPKNLKNKQLVVLNGLKEINQSLAISLKNFQNKGGTLLLFPAKGIELNSWNLFLSSIGISNLGDFEKINLECKKPSIESPFYKGVFEQKPKNILLPSVNGIYSVKNNFNSSILSLQNNKPLWLNQGSSYLYTSLLDSVASTIVSNSLFPVILLRIAELSNSKMDISHQLGLENRIQIYLSQPSNDINNPTSTFHLKNEELDLIPYFEEINNETFISLAGLQLHQGLKQGVYRLENDYYNSEIALNYSREESNIKTLNSDEINILFDGVDKDHLKYTSIESGSELLKVDLDKPQEFWRIFLLLALIFVLTEMALTRFMK